MVALAEALIFLPGASGYTHFWKPVAERLAHPAERHFASWPGFGGVPADPRLTRFEDLATRVIDAITHPVDLIAQSMGGVLAIQATLAKPALVQHLVLTATSGGIDASALGGVDWRPGFRQQHPDVPRWFEEKREDLTPRLREITCPVLLLWGDADPISPVAVGTRLATLLPHAELIVIEGGTHDLALERAADVAPHIERHLARR